MTTCNHEYIKAVHSIQDWDKDGSFGHLRTALNDVLDYVRAVDEHLSDIADHNNLGDGS